MEQPSTNVGQTTERRTSLRQIASMDNDRVVLKTLRVTFTEVGDRAKSPHGAFELRYAEVLEWYPELPFLAVRISTWSIRAR